MSYDLPSEFDFIVIGTGMTESILAAAFSRNGHSVLHIDRNDHYSGQWASFNLDGIEKWSSKHTQVSEEEEIPDFSNFDESSLNDGERLQKLPLMAKNVGSVSIKFHVQDEPENKPGDESIRGSDSVETPEESSEIEEEKSKNVEKHATEVGGSEEEASPKDTDSTKQAISDDTDSTKQANSDDTDSTKQAISDDTDSTKQANNDDPESHGNKDIASVIQKQIPDELNENMETKIDEQEAMDEKSGETMLSVEDSTDGSKICEDEADVVANKVAAVNVMESTQWTQSSIKKEWRRYNLDLAPRILYSSGDMVELLITSDIAKYCEFKTVSRVLTMLKDTIERVPCSRADVFSSKQISMIEKRMLMKFLTFCGNYDQHPEEYNAFKSSTFKEFLVQKKLTENLRHFIQFSIAMVTDSATTLEGLEKAKRYLTSLGRYGNTAFLWPLYGSGELPQAFCRMSAVFGGIYCLKTTAASLVLTKENYCQGIVTGKGQFIKSKWVIMESTYAPDEFVDNTPKTKFSRAILLTDTSILKSDGEELSLMLLPVPSLPERPITLLELPPSAQVCPANMHVVHLSQIGDECPQDDMKYALNKLFNECDQDSATDKPNILWSLYFTQEDSSRVEKSGVIPENVFLISGPGSEVDMDRPVCEAKDLFTRLLPGEEFLPKAPNPEDIIYVNDTEASANVEKSDLMSDERSEDTQYDDAKMSDGSVNADKQPENDETSASLNSDEKEENSVDEPLTENVQHET